MLGADTHQDQDRANQLVYWIRERELGRCRVEDDSRCDCKREAQDASKELNPGAYDHGEGALPRRDWCSCFNNWSVAIADRLQKRCAL